MQTKKAMKISNTPIISSCNFVADLSTLVQSHSATLNMIITTDGGARKSTFKCQ